MEMWREMDLLAKILLAAGMLNIGLSGSGKILDLIKDKTASKVDNKIAKLLHKVSSWLGKIIDWLGANRAH